ncbi:MAG: 5'/3'-nucleotidase SurE [Cyanobacteria bacterium P01_D01_bin.105]
MNILVSNDDGVFALGIRTLANSLARAGHSVTVVCPDRERSATGHGLTLHRPLRVEEAQGVFDPAVAAWACSGTPSDCVKLALDAVLPEAPDFVVSGINHGANLGTDVLYSGTVSAAMEGVLENIPAIAISLASFAYKNFQPAAQFAVQLIAQLEKNPLDLPILLNVNIPPVSAAEIQGTVIARQGIRRYYDQFEKRIDPRGKTYYWLAGEIIDEGDASLAVPNRLMGGREANGSERLQQELSVLRDKFVADVRAIKANKITVTPLKYNLTAHTALSFMDGWTMENLKTVELTDS